MSANAFGGERDPTPPDEEVGKRERQLDDPKRKDRRVMVAVVAFPERGTWGDRGLSEFLARS